MYVDKAQPLEDHLSYTAQLSVTVAAQINIIIGSVLELDRQWLSVQMMI
jgi:hypothetical protein